MAEVGCLNDGNFQNLQVEGRTDLGVMQSKYVDFMSGNTKNLSGTPKAIDDTAADAGVGGKRCREKLRHWLLLMP